jgi:hypothetical protein
MIAIPQLLQNVFPFLLVPGTARAWGRIGGLLAFVAVLGITKLLMSEQRWTSLGNVGSVKRAFGLPPSLPDFPRQWHLGVGWFWNHGIVGLAVLVFAVNAVVVLAARRRLIRTTT